MAFSIAPFFSDPDLDTLTFSATGTPPGLTLNAALGEFTGTPTTAGTYTVTVTATDPGTLGVSDTFTWSISPATNQAPTIVGAGIPDQTGQVGVAI